MKQPPALFHWLTAAALVDWLIGRTLTRAAIHMPKSPLMIELYQGFNLIGQFAATLAALLALAALIWIAWHEWETRRAVWLPLLLVSVAALSLLFVVIVPSGGLALAYQLLSLAAVALMTGHLRRISPILLVPAAAVLMSILYQIGPALHEALRWTEAPRFTDVGFYLGELFAVLSPIALWVVYGRGASRRVWLLTLLPAVGLAGMYLGSPSMTGVMAIWSTGLTLYLPWPLYAVSLWLAGVTVVVSTRRGSAVGMAILLLAAGGYAPQLSTLHFMGLVGLWLLMRPEPRSVEAAVTYLPRPAHDAAGV